MDVHIFLGCLMVVFCVHVTGNDEYHRRAATTHSPAAEISSLKNQLASLSRHFADFKNYTLEKIHALYDELHQKEELISNMSKDARNLKSQVYHVDHHLQSLDNYTKGQVDVLNHRLLNLENPVAFVAHFTNDSVDHHFHNHTGSGWYNKVLIFDLVQYQTGGHNYNQTSGVFTAPSKGTYAFFLTMQRNSPNDDSCLQAVILVNNKHQIATLSACPPGYATAASMAVVHLNAGDIVQVATHNPEKIFGFVHTLFSGFKINPH